MEVQQTSPGRDEGFVFGARLAIGLLQGLALYLLYSAFDAKSWPATHGLLFAPLVAVALFVPLLLSQALGNVRALTLILWTVAAAAIVAGFAAYDIWHGWPTEYQWSVRSDVPRLLPNSATFLFSAAFLFIGQALVIAGDGDRKFVADYHTDFDVAWKQGLQFALAGFFLAIFWALLWLGAALFKLINLDFLQKLIEHHWFAIPATALAIAAALHITDVRAVLVRGARSLVLALFSWLLLVIVLIAAGFLGSLFATGLEPLWKTRMATSLLLTAAAALIVLINAAYQDGDAERKPMRILRLAGSLGGLMLLPIVALAGYAVYLRTAQYGWTADRISAAACVAVAAAYALGYAIAALWPKDWFKPLEIWNFAVSLLVLAVIGALFSPLVDPMRIAVASQLARLESGRIAPEKFDFWYLRHEGGRFGKDALERLAKAKAGEIAAPAKAALTKAYPDFVVPPSKPVPAAELERRITMHPSGAPLPASFLSQNWAAAGVYGCLAEKKPSDWTCNAVLKDIDDDGIAEVVLLQSSMAGGWSNLTVFRFNGSVWEDFGAVQRGLCKTEADAILAGRFEAVPTHLRDLMVGGKRIALVPAEPQVEQCQ